PATQGRHRAGPSTSSTSKGFSGHSATLRAIRYKGVRMEAVSDAGGGDEREVELPDWVPEGVDITVPNVARMYDYMLGGYHNFRADREAVERVDQVFPNARQGAYINRAFLGRVVEWLIGAGGIRQFLDIGSGIPTAGNVHEIAERAAPGVRVMYVD